MPRAGFLEWVRFIQREADGWGIPLSARRARALVPAVIAAWEQEGHPLHADPTATEAIRRVLLAGRGIAA